MNPQRWRIIACFAASVAVSNSASALAPTIWDLAATPRLASDLIAYREAEQLFIKSFLPETNSTSARNALGAGLRVLERADIVHCPNMAPRFLYGRMLARFADVVASDEQTQYLLRSVAVLKEAVALAPDFREALAARYTLAVNYARLRNPRAEIATYDQLLQRESSAQDRAVALMNRAESFMVLGDTEEAIRGYRASLDVAPDLALAHWGLAVALDRSGDQAAAVLEAWSAQQLDPDALALHADNVFFVPNYDRYWYDALAAMARAEHEPDPSKASAAWRAAADLWAMYLQASEPTDRWMSAAIMRAHVCDRKAQAQRARLRRIGSTRIQGQ